MPPDLIELAERQDGLVTRHQALAFGVTPSAIRHALRPRGSWQRLAPGVYATFTGPLQDRHWMRGALLHAGPGALLTGSSACRGYGMKYVPATSSIDLLVPPQVRRSFLLFANIRRVKSMPQGRMVHGFPCAPPERSALDAVRNANRLRDVRATLCEVVQRGLASVERLIGEHDAIDPRGLSRARRALLDVRAGCRSAPECELRDLILRSRVLSEPIWNEPLPEAADIVADARYDDARLVLEVDSVEWHRFGDAPEKTERRRARLASLGWRTLPISPRRIREEPAAVSAEIEAAVMGQLPRSA